MICIARTFGAPETVPAGKPAASASSGPQSFLDIRHDVHDLAVALNEELVCHFDGAYLGNPADVVAAEIEQHEVLGALLGIGEEFGFKRQIFARRSAAWPRAGDRTNSDNPAGGLDHDFRA